MATQQRTCSARLSKPSQRSLRKVSLLVALPLFLNSAVPAFALKQQAPEEGAGLEELKKELLQFARATGLVSSSPPIGASHPVSALSAAAGAEERVAKTLAAWAEGAEPTAQGGLFLSQETVQGLAYLLKALGKALRDSPQGEQIRQGLLAGRLFLITEDPDLKGFFPGCTFPDYWAAKQVIGGRPVSYTVRDSSEVPPTRGFSLWFQGYGSNSPIREMANVLDGIRESVAGRKLIGRSAEKRMEESKSLAMTLDSLANGWQTRPISPSEVKILVVAQNPQDRKDLYLRITQALFDAPEQQLRSRINPKKQIHLFSTIAGAKEWLSRNEPTLVFAGWNFNQGSGRDFIQTFRASHASVPLVVIKSFPWNPGRSIEGVTVLSWISSNSVKPFVTQHVINRLVPGTGLEEPAEVVENARAFLAALETLSGNEGPFQGSPELWRLRDRWNRQFPTVQADLDRGWNLLTELLTKELEDLLGKTKPILRTIPERPMGRPKEISVLGFRDAARDVESALKGVSSLAPGRSEPVKEQLTRIRLAMQVVRDNAAKVKPARRASRPAAAGSKEMATRRFYQKTPSAAGLEEGAKVAILNGLQQGPVREVVFNGAIQNPGLLAAASEDGSIHIWDPGKNSPFKVIRPQGNVQRILLAAFRRLGTVVLMIGEESAESFDVPNKIAFGRIDYPDLRLGSIAGSVPPDGIALSPGRTVLAVADPEKKEVVLQNLVEARKAAGSSQPKGVLARIRLDPKSGSPVSVAFRPEKEGRFADGRFLVVGTDDGKVEIWNIGGAVRGRQPQRLGDPLVGIAGKIGSLSIYPTATGDLLAAGNDQGKVQVWDGRKGSRSFEVLPEMEDREILALAFSPDGRILAFAGEGGTIHFLDLETRRFLESRRLEERNPVSIQSLAFNPPGTQVAAGRADGTTLLADVPRPVASGLEEVTATVFAEIREGLGSFQPSGVERDEAHIFDPENAAVGQVIAAVIGADPVVIIARDAEQETELLASGFGGLGRMILRLDLHASIEEARADAARRLPDFSPRFYRAQDRKGNLPGWLAGILERYNVPDSLLSVEQAERIIHSLEALRAA